MGSVGTLEFEYLKLAVGLILWGKTRLWVMFISWEVNNITIIKLVVGLILWGKTRLWVMSTSWEMNNLRSETMADVNSRFVIKLKILTFLECLVLSLSTIILFLFYSATIHRDVDRCLLQIYFFKISSCLSIS